jgi:hypothetical protein
MFLSNFEQHETVLCEFNQRNCFIVGLESKYLFHYSHEKQKSEEKESLRLQVTKVNSGVFLLIVIAIFMLIMFQFLLDSTLHIVH